MRIAVIQSDEKPLPKSIQIIATKWFKKIGRVQVNLIGNTYVAYIESYSPGKGVAKKLSLKLDQVLTELSKLSGKSFLHKIVFQTEEAKLRLEHYLERYGKALGYKIENGIWYKRYKP